MVERRAAARWFCGATETSETGAGVVPLFSMTNVTMSEVDPGVSTWSSAETTASEYEPQSELQRAAVERAALGTAARRSERWPFR